MELKFIERYSVKYGSYLESSFPINGYKIYHKFIINETETSEDFEVRYLDNKINNVDSLEDAIIEIRKNIKTKHNLNVV